MILNEFTGRYEMNTQLSCPSPLASVLCTLIIDKLRWTQRAVLQDVHIYRAAQLALDAYFSQQCVDYANEVWERIVANNGKRGMSRQERAELTVSPSEIEAELRSRDFKMALSVPTVFAAIIESLIERIELDPSHLSKYGILIKNETTFPKSVVDHRMRELLKTKIPDIRFGKQCFDPVWSLMQHWLSTGFDNVKRVNTTRIQKEEITQLLNMCRK